MKYFRAMVIGSILPGLAIGWWLDGAVHAALAEGAPPPKGLFAEVAISVDDATVRRIRDREEDVVCYVATGIPKAGYGTDGRNVAISCIQLTVVNP